MNTQRLPVYQVEFQEFNPKSMIYFRRSADEFKKFCLINALRPLLAQYKKGSNHE